jgi:hypothetical protein
MTSFCGSQFYWSDSTARRRREKLNHSSGVKKRGIDNSQTIGSEGP